MTRTPTRSPAQNPWDSVLLDIYWERVEDADSELAALPWWRIVRRYKFWSGDQ